MKYIIGLLSLTLLSGCGLSNQFCEHNTDQFNLICYDQNTLKNQEQDKKLSELEQRINLIEQESALQRIKLNDIQSAVESIDRQVDNNTTDINSLYTLLSVLDVALNSANTLNQTRYNQLVNDYTLLSNMVDTNSLDIAAIQSILNNLTQPSGIIDNIQTAVNNNTTTLAIIQGYEHITEILDPCLDHPTKTDEVFFRMSDGKIISSFSDNANGLNTRFSIVTPSDTQVYSTTDGSSCNFKIPATGVNANKVCWGVGYATCI